MGIIKKITAALIGAGNRGMDAYGSYVLEHPLDIQYIAAAEPDNLKMDKLRQQHNIPSDMCFKDWRELLEKPRLADAVLICTQDKMHFEAAIMAMEKGYHILLEKPMAITPLECIKLGEYARQLDRVFIVAHVLRYTTFFTTIKRLLDEGKIGRLVSIQHNENVGNIHHSHSYVRGNWRNSLESSPMILAKSCHDMDIMLWLAGADCTYISSFGSLTHFKEENAPEGAPKRCLDGCPSENKCPYNAAKVYLSGNTGWPVSVVSEDTSYAAVKKALLEGPYGRCVYRCDNDVVDHQVANIQFANGVTASFTMCAFTKPSRTIKLMGTEGEIRGHMENNEIEITNFNKGTTETILLEASTHGHSGGDYGIMESFIAQIQNGSTEQILTSAAESTQSHLMAFAAEVSRTEKKVVDLQRYTEELKHD